MFDIGDIISSCSRPDAREVIYFLSRYFKQASFLDKDGKDIFHDVFDRSPTEAIREATMAAIASIEKQIGQTASELSDEDSYGVLRQLARLESDLQEDVTEEERSVASAFFSRLDSR